MGSNVPAGLGSNFFRIIAFIAAILNVVSFIFCSCGDFGSYGQGHSLRKPQRAGLAQAPAAPKNISSNRASSFSFGESARSVTGCTGYYGSRRTSFCIGPAATSEDPAGQHARGSSLGMELWTPEQRHVDLLLPMAPTRHRTWLRHGGRPNKRGAMRPYRPFCGDARQRSYTPRGRRRPKAKAAGKGAKGAEGAPGPSMPPLPPPPKAPAITFPAAAAAAAPASTAAETHLGNLLTALQAQKGNLPPEMLTAIEGIAHTSASQEARGLHKAVSLQQKAKQELARIGAQRLTACASWAKYLQEVTETVHKQLTQHAATGRGGNLLAAEPTERYSRIGSALGTAWRNRGRRDECRSCQGLGSTGDNAPAGATSATTATATLVEASHGDRGLYGHGCTEGLITYPKTGQEASPRRFLAGVHRRRRQKGQPATRPGEGGCYLAGALRKAVFS